MNSGISASEGLRVSGGLCGALVGDALPGERGSHPPGGPHFGIPEP